VDALNLPRLEVENYEADDVLGSAARQAVEGGLAVKIITGDRDLLQLVEPRIIVSLPGKSLSDSKDYLPEDVVEMLGVRPDQVVDYKALVGDKSDNIPGVAGIGEKTAVSLLQDYHTLEGIYEHLDDLSSSLSKKLVAGRENAWLSRKLATIVKDLPVEVDLERARPQAFDPQRVEALFRELEFRTLMTRLNELQKSYGMSPASKGQQLSMFAAQLAQPSQEIPRKAALLQTSPAARKVVIVNTPETLAELRQRLETAQMIALDTETTSTDQMRAELVGLSFAVEPGAGYYVPVGHRQAEVKQLQLDQIIAALGGALNDPQIAKMGHNIKYDLVVMIRHGLAVSPVSFDTMIAEWLVNPASRNLGLKNLAWVRQGVQMTPIEDLIGKGKKQISMAEIPVQQAADYAVADVEVLFALRDELQGELETSQAAPVMHTMEMPLVSILAEMEMAGVALDTGYLSQMSEELRSRLEEIEKKVTRHVGVGFNLNSPQQLSEALFSRLKIEPSDRSARTATGFFSTSAEALESLRGAHPVVDLVLEYRELSKLKSTYLDALPLQVNPQTGRVHTSFNQTGSVTGRLASSEPNLQNIPIRTELGRRVRNAFVAQPGHVLLSVDYSQIELRIVAHMADDQTMKAAFLAGQDIHSATAAAIYGLRLEAVDKDMRRRAKGINFGLIYGMSAFGLSRTADLTLAEAENFVAAYFERFPGVKKYLDGIRKLAAEQGYVETLLGRRRYFPGLKSQSNYNVRSREEREAINAPIQGTAADIMKIAMLRIPPALKKAGLAARMILQVHDEVVLECPKDQLADCAAVVQQVMEDAYPLSVPLLTEARYGPNWGEMKIVQ
jgi:DNA polymerase-1